jgi:hypothetical protein
MPVIMGAKQEKDFIIMNNKAVFLLILSLGWMLCSCEDDSEGNNIAFFPEVQVNTSVNILFPQFSSLNLIQGYVYLPEGYL